MALLGIDLGTTHIKAGVFAEDGSQLAIARRQTPVARHTQGCLAYDPEEFWLATISAVCEAVASGSEEIQSVGIASMAESGLFVDPASGKSLTPILPWFDTTPAGQALRLEGIIGRREGFFHTGIYPSFKISLAKILWLQDSGFQPVVGKTIWLSAADYVLFRLTGVPATDASLAGRTYAFHIGSREWDEELLGRVGLKA